MYRKIVPAAIAWLLFAFAPASKKKVAIVFVGDSITYGAGIAGREDKAPPAVATSWLNANSDATVVCNNQGRSGFTTVDYLPATHKAFYQVTAAADALQQQPADELLFSVMLGTNDSAEQGPNGSPVAPAAYHANLRTITDSLLAHFPRCKIVLQCPTWYSTNTYNGARYLAAGLARLQTYVPEIKALVKEYKASRPGHVFLGDEAAYTAFEKNATTYLQPENGRQGVFYLHPNEKGAAVLGEYWAKAIRKVL